MSDAQNTTPREILIETVGFLLMTAGGYKDAAEADAKAQSIYDGIVGTDATTGHQALAEIARLFVQVDGVSNLIEGESEDAAEDTTIRFVKDQGEALPEGPVSDQPMTLEQIIKSIFGKEAEVQIVPLNSRGQPDFSSLGVSPLN